MDLGASLEPGNYTLSVHIKDCLSKETASFERRFACKAAEFAIVKIRDTQLIGLVAAGNRRAKMARVLLSNLDASLSATQLGITLASLGLGWVGEPVFASLLAPAMEWLNIESAQMRHYAMAKTAAIVQVHGTGPFVLTYVNPADDPSQRAK